MGSYEEAIFPESPLAARQEQMTLWVSRTGRVYKNEALARSDGSTHNKCSCGEPAEKPYTRCFACLVEDKTDMYNSMPVTEWGQKTPLCLFGDGVFFYCIEEIEDYCEEFGVNQSSLKLALCEPEYARTIDCDDLYEDLLPDDGECPQEIKDAFDELNKKIKEYGKPLCWAQGKKRVSL